MMRSVDHDVARGGRPLQRFLLLHQAGAVGRRLRRDADLLAVGFERGHAETWAFLDHRIGDVMQIEKVRGAAREWVAKLPDPFGIFATGSGGKR